MRFERMKKVWLYFVAVVLLCGCGAVRNDVLPIVDLMQEAPEGVRFYSLFEFSHFTVLDESVTIGGIDKIVLSDTLIYILDSKTESVCMFGTDGRRAGEICRKGRGPDEYVSCSDFDIDEYGNVWILDSQSGRLLRYGVSGELIEAEKIPHAGTFIRIGDKGVACNFRNVPEDGHRCSNYLYRGAGGETAGANFNSELCGRYVRHSCGVTSFYRFGDDLYAIFPANDTLYVIEPDNGRLVPVQRWRMRQSMPSASSAAEDVKSYLSDWWNGRSAEINGLYVFGDYRMITYNDDKRTAFAVADCSSGLICKGRLTADADGLSIYDKTYLDRRSDASAGYFISAPPAYALRSALKYRIENSRPVSDRLRRIVNVMEETNDNPVLIFYKLKDAGR